MFADSNCASGRRRLKNFNDTDCSSTFRIGFSCPFFYSFTRFLLNLLFLRASSRISNLPMFTFSWTVFSREKYKLRKNMRSISLLLFTSLSVIVYNPLLREINFAVKDQINMRSINLLLLTSLSVIVYNPLLRKINLAVKDQIKFLKLWHGREKAS